MTGKSKRYIINTVFSISVLLGLVVAGAFMGGCATAPKTGTDTGQPVLSELELFLANGEWDKGSEFVFPASEEFVLSNGLKVVVVEKHDIPMVYARAQIRGGSI